MKKQALSFTLLALLSCSLFMGLKIKLDSIPREKIPGASVIYIPSGKYLKYAAFGYSSFMADLIYIWAIQYYSTYSVVDRYQNLEHIFSIIAELDPRYLDPYELGAIIAVYEARDLELGLKILDLGLEKNPDQWIFPYQAAHYAQMNKDFKLAREYYLKAMNIEGAPRIIRRLYANSLFKIGDLESAWKNWLEIYNSTDDERIKKIASNHLYQVKASLDKEKIEEALESFKEKYGYYPQNLNQLVSEGLLESLPTDLDGNDYLYNPQTGEVSTPIIPWKR